jgi:hypothetical protein
VLHTATATATAAAADNGYDGDDNCVTDKDNVLARCEIQSDICVGAGSLSGKKILMNFKLSFHLDSKDTYNFYKQIILVKLEKCTNLRVLRYERLSIAVLSLS